MAIKRQTKLNFILNALNFLADKQTLVVMVGHGFFPVVYKTRTTIVVRNAGCARSRYTQKFSLIFLIT